MDEKSKKDKDVKDAILVPTSTSATITTEEHASQNQLASKSTNTNVPDQATIDKEKAAEKHSINSATGNKSSNKFGNIEKFNKESQEIYDLVRKLNSHVVKGYDDRLTFPQRSSTHASRVSESKSRNNQQQGINRK